MRNMRNFTAGLLFYKILSRFDDFWLEIIAGNARDAGRALFSHNDLIYPGLEIQERMS